MSQKYADIIIDISHSAIDRVYQYRIPDTLVDMLQVGMLVSVPFGKGNAMRQGYVIGITETPSFDVELIKEVQGIPEKALPIEGKLIRLAAWMRETYGSTMNRALQTVMPVKQAVRKTAQKVEVQELSIGKAPVLELNEEQRQAVDAFAQDFAASNYQTYLLHGVTGSGKTEVYIACMKEVIRQGGQAILLIPEIALTPQNVARLRQHFDDRVAFVHSKQSKGEKYQQFERVRGREVDVMIGPRSALFAPFPNLKLIILDEEHDSSYKSDSTPKYHARDVAVARARLEGASVILGSATPSMESYHKAMLGEYKLWKLTKRPDNSCLSTVSVVDLREELRRGNRSIISYELHRGIEDRLAKKEQIMLFMNRRGFHSFVSCRACGEPIKCPHCDVSLTLHKYGADSKETLTCHYCGYHTAMPKVCPSCKSRMIAGFGTGTEKIEEEIHRRFPKARTLRMDKDTTERKGADVAILKKFSEGKADILIGTQMIVKGHDYENVTLVGVILADISLYANDFRASERTFDLLTQAVGRAGRGDKPGHAVIQTYQPEHYAIESATKQDYEGFFEMEMAYRRLLHYPPVEDMLQVLLEGESKGKVSACAQALTEQIKECVAQNGFRRTRVVGPSEAHIAKKNDVYRFVVYVKAPGLGAIAAVRDRIDACKWDGIVITTDVNPLSVQ